MFFITVAVFALSIINVNSVKGAIDKPSLEIEPMGVICHGGSTITGSTADGCTDCDDCNYYLGRTCLGWSSTCSR